MGKLLGDLGLIDAYINVLLNNVPILQHIKSSCRILGASAI